MNRVIDHLYIFLTIIFAVYGQLIIRWQVSLNSGLPPDFQGKLSFICSMLLNPWVITAIVATFCSGISWMLAMARFDISYAFPFMSLNYLLIMGAGYIWFAEAITLYRVLGTALIVLGVIMVATKS